MTTPEIQGYEAVRSAARNWEECSSELTGDRDVRHYRQLPLELDPPRHTALRRTIEPAFLGEAIRPLEPRFEERAAGLVEVLSEQGGEVGRDLALPYVVGCLAMVLGREQDIDEWISWGPDVWTAAAYRDGQVSEDARRAHRERDFSATTERSGRLLHDYLYRVLADAEVRAGAGVPETDFWDRLVRTDVDGQPLSRVERLGVGSVLMAGGRDTVIKLVTGITWYLLHHPNVQERLAAEPNTHGRAIAELVRYLSPLSKIERVRRSHPGMASDAAEPEHVLLNFASANHDPEIWDDPGTVRLDRPRTVPHLGFGFGPHSCMGKMVAEAEARAFLRAFLSRRPSWKVVTERIAWAREGNARVLERFDELSVEPT